jgi:hypothetical protein
LRRVHVLDGTNETTPLPLSVHVTGSPSKSPFEGVEEYPVTVAVHLMVPVLGTVLAEHPILTVDCF